jgi:hypothetical protein
MIDLVARERHPHKPSAVRRKHASEARICAPDASRISTLATLPAQVAALSEHGHRRLHAHRYNDQRRRADGRVHAPAKGVDDLGRMPLWHLEGGT